MRTIAIDFDKVIHTYEKGWHDGTIYGEFVPGTAEALQDIMSKHPVFIFTTRKPKPVARWIEEKSEGRIKCTTRVPRSGFWRQRGTLLITDRKLPAFAYIDDRAIGFRSWSQALTALSMMIRREVTSQNLHVL